MDISQKLILIVDDNIKNLEVIAKILKEEGFLLSLAQSGSDALGQLNNIIPDLILLDIMMPEMDGFETCKRIKKNEKLKDIPVIFVTAKNQTDDIVSGFKVGGVDYVAKPFNRDELVIRVRNHIELADSKKIVELSRHRDKIYSIIAHDIRSPFVNIKMIIDLIASGRFNINNSDFNGIIASLEKKADATFTLLNNLLEWTKNQSGAISISPKTLKIYPLLQECIELLKANADSKNITLKLDAPEYIEAFFDEITMHTVFRNLISNAIKFTPENGIIQLHAKIYDDNLQVLVEDNGVGMSPEILNTIFEKNEHYTSLGTKKEQGSGLGLMMIKDFIEQNHGSLHVQSEQGKGTTFTITIPINPVD